MSVFARGLPALRATEWRSEVCADQDRGAELRTRAAQALALWAIQREPGCAGAAVRGPHCRHRSRRPGRARGSGACEGSRCVATRGVPAIASGPAARRTPPRTGRHRLQLRRAAGTHRRRRQRATGLRPCAVLRSCRPRWPSGPALREAQGVHRTPCVHTHHRHIRGKYACRCCQTLQVAALPAQIIDKGLPAPGLLAQVAIAKHDDHLPLCRQTEIYARSG